MTSLDDFAASHADCANRLTELEATVRLLEEENARIKASFNKSQADLGAAAFVASERTRNSIVAWLVAQADDDPERLVSWASAADRIAACEDIDPP